jgi:hypothetical protein
MPHARKITIAKGDVKINCPIAADQAVQHSCCGAGHASLGAAGYTRCGFDPETAMGSLVDSVMGNLSEAQVAAIATKLGTDPVQARNAIEHALPLIVGGMAQNASTAQGASALNNALREHAGFDISDVLSGILSGGGASGSGIGGAIRRRRIRVLAKPPVWASRTPGS